LTSTDPSIDAAAMRVEALLEQLTRVDLQLVVVSPPDATRRSARERAREAAEGAGRGAMFEDATTAARETAIRAFASGGFSGTWAATERSASVASAQDRVAAAAAFEEAAMAAVVEDLVGSETLEVLEATIGGLQRFRGIPAPGSLSTFTERAGPDLSGLGSGQSLAVGLIFVAAVLAFAIAGFGGALLVVALGASIAGWFARRRSGGDRP
jgi:hypothetical protein